MSKRPKWNKGFVNTGGYRGYRPYRKKTTLGGFFKYWVLPTLGIVIPIIICLAHKGYLSVAK